MKLHLLAFALLLAGLPLTTTARERTRGAFEGEGKVLAIDEAKSTITLDHGPIPGLMPPMRMRLPVRSRSLLRGVSVGDTVWFSLGSRGEAMVILDLEPLDGAQGAAEPEAPRAPVGGAATN